MTANQIKNAVQDILNEETFYEVVGLRFEEMDRSIGDRLANSKHNPDREDTREFPAYGSVDYDDLPELDGTSAWDVSRRSIRSMDSDLDYAKSAGMHCYLIGGDEGSHDDPDEAEILVRNATVIKKIF